MSGHSAYEATPIKAYSLSSESPRTGTPKRKSYLSTLPVPIFDDDVRIGRMHVPPVIKCEVRTISYEIEHCRNIINWSKSNNYFEIK